MLYERNAGSKTLAGSPWNLGSLIVLAMGTFVMVCIQMGTSGMISDIALGLGSSEGAIAVSVTAFSLTVSVSTIPMFLLLRRFSRKSVLVMAFATAAAACLGVGIAGSAVWFTVGRTIGGIAHALFSMASLAYIALTVDSKYLGRSLTIAGSGSALAVWIGIPLMTWVGKEAAGWRIAFLGLGVLTFLVCGLVVFLLPGDKLPRRSGEGSTLPWSHDGRWSGIRNALSIIVQANAASLIYAAAYYVVFSYIGIWLRDVPGVSAQEIVILLLISGSGAIVGMAAAGPIADLWGTKFAQTILFFVMIGEAFVLIAIGLLGSGSTFRAIAMFLLGVPGGAVAVTQQARVTDLTPEFLQPATAAGLTIAGNGGMAVAGMLGGVFIASGESWALPWATVMLSLIALFIDRVMAERLSLKSSAV